MIWHTCQSTPPQSLRENRVTLKAFMPFQIFQSSCCVQSKSSLNWEVSGRERWFGAGAKARGQSIMKHINTKLCVDSLPLRLPIHHSRPLIPLRSAHQGQRVPIQRTQPHLVEPNSRIILVGTVNEAGVLIFTTNICLTISAFRQTQF